MQNRYAGDVGDFGKFALLRAIAFDCKVGIIWYLTSEAREESRDGKHLDYLRKPDRFRKLDCELFDRLNSFRDEFTKSPKLRSVRQLEQCRLLKSAAYFAEEVPIDGKLRMKWASKIVQSEISASEILFLDPDNGIQGDQLTHKHVALEEISLLRHLKKPLVIYHHQTRVKGGAYREAQILGSKMRAAGCKRVELIRLRPYSSRFYIVADHNELISQRLADFVSRWEGFVQVY